jgi:hypothetical protein
MGLVSSQLVDFAAVLLISGLPAFVRGWKQIGEQHREQLRTSIARLEKELLDD